MNQFKNFIKKHFGSFVYFYSYLRYKIFIAIGLSITISILDAFGLSMFLPLLQIVNSADKASAEGMGNLRFLVDGMEALGINLTIGSVLAFMLLFFLIKGIVSYISMVYIVILQQSFIKSIRLKLLNSLNKINFKIFVTSDAGRIQNTMSGEVDRVAQAYNTYFGAFQQGVMVAVYMGFAFFVNAQFAILVSIGGAITNILYKIIYKHTKGASRKLTSSNSVYQGQIIQHVSNFKYLKATATVQKYGDKLRDTINKIESSRKRIGVLVSIGLASREPLLVAVVACVILIQTRLLGGEMGVILISLLFFYRALSSLVAMQQLWNSFVSVSGSLENMRDFQNELDLSMEKNGQLQFEKLKSSIELRDVTFSFGQTSILKNINLNILKNQSVAFVGESGSGKTTLVNLIAGLLPQDKGDILVDGFAIKDLDKDTYQNRIGYITQDPVIFSDTIFNNITLWADPTPKNKNRFEYALKQASLDTFLRTLPMGKDTELGNNGINLSGGQKQRISIARELYKDIDVLIMDEATSALDSETELAIQQSIDSLQGQYTLLIIAHRLATVRDVDRVIYMNNGNIEKEGSFSTLLKIHPSFKKMVQLQEI